MNSMMFHVIKETCAALSSDNGRQQRQHNQQPRAAQTIATEHGLKDGENKGCEAELFIQPWKISMFKPGAAQDMTAPIEKL